MKKVEMYRCEICENLFQDKNDAQDCEKTHKTELEISNTYYEEFSGEPKYVIIKINNRERAYKLMSLNELSEIRDNFKNFEPLS